MSREPMQIGEVASRTGLSLRTIRYYEEVGLIVPPARTAGRFRLYVDEDVARLELIKKMKPLGFSIEDMRDLLQITEGIDSGEAVDNPAQMLERLAEIHQATEERVLELKAQLVTAKKFAHDLAVRLEAQASASAKAR